MACDDVEVMKDILQRDGFVPLVDALYLFDNTTKIKEVLTLIPGSFLGRGPDGLQAVLVKKLDNTRK